METETLKKQQVELAKKVSLEDGFGKITAVAGFDIAYSGRTAFCSAAVLGWSSMEVMEHKTIQARETFPYIPGFLAFREAPHIVRLFKKLTLKPDVILIDGQGICHPRGMGLASHVGVLLDMPSIGVAKSRLCGEYEEGESASKLFLEGRHVGWVSKRKGSPVFISPGHKVSVNSSLEIVSHCTREGQRIPEPLRLAHLYAEKAKNKYQAARHDFEAHFAKAIRNENRKA
jgi:deoxyribonuclease V